MTRADFTAFEFLKKSAEAKAWIQEVLGEQFEGDDMHRLLQTGIILCRVVNAIWPGTIPKINPSNSFSFKLIENINFFLKVATSKGLNTRELFAPNDLFEKKNMPLVINCVQKVAEKAVKEGYPIKWSRVEKNDFSAKEIQDAKKLPSLAAPVESANISEDEKRKRQEADQKKKEAEKAAEDELKKKLAEQEAEEARLLAERLQEEARQKAEAEAKRIKEEREHELNKQTKEMEAEYMAKKREADEMQARIDRLKQEEAEITKSVKYGGKANLEKMRQQYEEYKAAAAATAEDDGNSVLHIAVLRNNPDIIPFLLDEGYVDRNALNANKDTALHLAARAGDDKAVAQLLAKGAKVNLINRDLDIPLHLAVRSGNAEAVRQLLQAGSEVDARNVNFDTPLLLACKGGDVKVVKLFLEKGADINAVNKDEESPLHFAASSGNVEFVTALSKAGTLDLNPRNKENATPLQMAAEKGHLDIVKLLVELGADLNTKTNEGWSPVYTSAYNGDASTVYFLLSKGADVDGVNEEGWTPLHAACAQGHLEVVKTMVENFNATVNVLNNQGTTPLFHAVSAGRRTIASYLVEKKNADINLSAEGGWKPVHAACYNEFVKLTTFLVKHNADLDSPCKEIRGYSPLHILISTDKAPEELIQLLVQKGANLNVQNDTGGTPLHLAVFWGHLNVVKTIVTAGARLDIKNSNGRTPLDLAATYGHKKIAEFLSEKMGVKMPELKAKQRKTLDMAAPVEPPKPNE